MSDQDKKNNSTEDIKKASSTQDFEMGDEDEPKINNYLNDVKPKEPPASSQVEVNPSSNAPIINLPPSQRIYQPQQAQKQPSQQSQPQQFQTPQQAVQQPQSPQGQTIGQAKMGVQQQSQMSQPQPKTSVPNPVARKRALLGCLGFFGAIMMIFLVLAFIFIGQSDKGTQTPLAKMLGVDQAAFVNSLITLIHVVFILFALITFVFTMVGLFKASMMKKDDKIGKKEALKTSLIAGILLILILIIWVFVYAYLDGKRVQIGPQVKDPIITTPEETINLKAPVQIKFDASNIPVDSNKKIIFYEWDFGDGSPLGTGVIITHQYEKKGKFDVILKVILQDKKTLEELPAEYGATVSVTDQALTATFSSTPQSGEAPLKVEFDASESVDPDGTIEKYEWDLDNDGEFDDAEGVKTEYEFEKIGIYKVTLRVTSTIGDFETSEKEIVVEEKQDPEAVIKVVDEPSEYTIGVNYVFNGEESSSPKGKIVKYEWNFNDGSKVQTTKTVSHVFEKAGTYEVTLKITDEKDNSGETKLVIKVESPKGTPKVKISTDPALSEGSTFLEGKAPFAIVFDATGTTDSDNNIVNYEWDFNSDGTVDGYGESISYTYLTEGNYTAKLIVTDADNNTSIGTLVVKVLPQGISAKVEADKVEGSVPLNVTFDASGSTYDKGQITSYEWDFGDDSTPKFGTATITHKYTKIGTFTAKVKVIGSDNSSSTAEIVITVREIPLQACFVSVFEKGVAPLETTFDPGCSTGTISSYFWDFGDGKTSTDVKPAHTYETAGTYTATLEISDGENNISKAEVEIVVTEE